MMIFIYYSHIFVCVSLTKTNPQYLLRNETTALVAPEKKRIAIVAFEGKFWVVSRGLHAVKRGGIVGRRVDCYRARLGVARFVRDRC